MSIELFDGVTWRRVTLENMGILTASALTGVQTVVDECCKVWTTRATIIDDYAITLNKRSYACRINFIEAVDAAFPGTITNANLILSAD